MSCSDVTGPPAERNLFSVYDTSVFLSGSDRSAAAGYEADQLLVIDQKITDTLCD